MNGILLVTHGDVGRALLQCVTHVYGTCPACIEVCAVQGVDEEAKLRVKVALERVCQSNETVLILTDIYGASPSNTVAQFLEPGRIAMLSGVNVPMLLRALSYRHESLEVLCQKALEGGMRGIVYTTSARCEKGLQS